MASTAILAGRVAIVTGGGSGIGRATCELFAKNGANVVVVDRGQSGVDGTLANISQALALRADGTGQVHRSFVADVCDGNAVRSLVAEVTGAYKGPPTILVNSAGITRDQILLRMKEEEFDEVINVNLKGTFLMAQAVSQAMVQAKVAEGSIINIGSISGKTGNVGQANYSASKAGVVGLTKTLAKELSRFNIRCNTVLPGFIKTPMTDKMPEKVVKMMMQFIPLGILGEPEQIAEACLFLASSRSSYMTGASLDVTGGLGM